MKSTSREGDASVGWRCKVARAVIDDERRLTLKRSLLLAPAVALIVAALAFPIFSLVRTSFATGSGTNSFRGWTLVHYGDFFRDPLYLQVVAQTLWYGVIVTVGTAIVAFPLAYALARATPRRRRIGLSILMLPLMLSFIVSIFGWIVILGRGGLLNSVLMALHLIDEPLRILYTRNAVLFVLGYTFFPFQVLSILGVVTQIDPVLEQAAASLRANRWTTYRRVIIPLAFRGIASGSVIVFMATISAFATPRLIGGSRVQMLGALIYEQIVVVLNWPFGATMSVVLLAIVLALVAALSVIGRAYATRARVV
jgi:putative spermidine/putrescine transport system permease protein